MLSAVKIYGQNDLNRTEAQKGINQLSAATAHHETLTGRATFNPDLTGNDVFQEVSSFYYKERVRLTFSVSEAYRSGFSLIRGLMEFNRSKALSFVYDRQHGSISTDVNAGQLEELQKFLARVSNLYLQEKQFRDALRNVLAFEDRYRRERDSIYASFKNTTTAVSAVG